LVISDQKKNSPALYAESQHHIKKEHIDSHAREIIDLLIKSGFKSYLVGGCIRDLILNKKPKDFDVVTEATPEQIKKTIPRSRIIGRRFKLVHVRKGRQITEVSTFRTKGGKRTAKTNKGIVIRDNFYGTIKEDAFRRDFTLNSLYLDLSNMQIIDYTGGYKDLKNKLIISIGDSKLRFREDPVRIIRAVRFLNNLNLTMRQSLKKDLINSAYLLQEVPSARRYEEVLKLFLTGNAKNNFLTLLDFKTLKYLLPDTAKYSTSNKHLNFIITALNSSDKRVKNNLPLTPAFLFSVLLWPSLTERIGEVTSKNTKIPALLRSANIILKQQKQHCFIPNRIESMIKDIWEFQIRLLKIPPKSKQIVNHKRFRASYDFLLLREEAGVNLGGAGKWWGKNQANNFNSRRNK